MGHLPTKIARIAGHLNNFFKCPGFAGGGGGCSRLYLPLQYSMFNSIFTIIIIIIIINIIITIMAKVRGIIIIIIIKNNDNFILTNF